MSTDNARNRILEAAGAVFAEHGYESATVREICEKAGVNLAGVNYYFGGKERLYVETLERAHQCQTQEQGEADWPSGTPPQQKLKQFIHRLLANLLRLKGEPWQVRLLMREIVNPTPAGKKLLGNHFREGFDQLQAILDDILPADTPLYKRHQVALSIISQCTYYRSAGRIISWFIEEDELREHFGIEQLAEHIAEISWAALGLGPPLCAAAKKTDSRSASCKR